jgi:succinate dehydrogenase / fumarate reductase cytochrome b subunit
MDSLGSTNAESDSRDARRPLSPHLSVYRPMMTMMMSIAHRITGAGLYIAMALLTLLFLGVGTGGFFYGAFGWLGSSTIGGLLVFMITWAIYHHLLGGVRHFLWDRGLYMDPKGRETLAIGTLAGGVGLTVLTWIVRGMVD